jgi:SAM-dependent methyltransferase
MTSGIRNESLHKSVLSPCRIAAAASLRGRILDCGGGLGEYLPYFVDSRPVVFDISLPALGSLRHGEKVCGDGSALPFADNSFDGVWACAVAQYLHLDSFVAELKRVTRPGGRILLLVPNGRSPWDWLKKLAGMDGWWDQENIVTQYSVDELAAYGKVIGEIRFLPMDRLFRRFPRLCHTLLLEIGI